MFPEVKSVEIAVEFPYSGDDFIAAKYELRWWRIWRRFMLVMGPGFFSAMAMVELGLEVRAGRSVADALASTLAMVALGVLHGLTPLLIRRFDRFNHRRNMPDGTLQQRRFGPLGFAISAGVALTPWGLITEVHETSRAFLISDASSTVRSYMPKQALSPDQHQSFRELVAREFISRPDKLKVRPGRNHRTKE
jgi:hypothetical protein